MHSTYWYQFRFHSKSTLAKPAAERRVSFAAPAILQAESSNRKVHVQHQAGSNDARHGKGAPNFSGPPGHPAVGISLVGPNASGRLSSSSEGLLVSLVNLYEHRTSAWNCWSDARTNAFEVMFLVMMDHDVELLTLRAKKILKICCTPAVGGLLALLTSLT